MNGERGRKGGMGKRAAAAAEKVDRLLEDRELEVLARSSDRLASLRPKVSDPVAFDALIAATQEATRLNEDIAAFRRRVEALGSAAVKVAGELVTKLKL